MKRGVTFIVIVGIALVFFAVALFSMDFGSNSNGNTSAGNENTATGLDNGANVNGVYDGASGNGEEGVGSVSSGGSSAAGGGGGGGSSGGSSNAGPSNGGNAENDNNTNDASCMLVRPGNLPGVDCSVNSINKNSVSLKLKNELGENISLEIKIDTCSTVSGEMDNLGEKDFVFSCNNQGYFSQAIHLAYIIRESRFEIGGFVSGTVY